MSKDLLKRAEEEITVLKLAVESLGYLQIEEDNALKFIALIQEMHDKIKGDAERLESVQLLEAVAKAMYNAEHLQMKERNAPNNAWVDTFSYEDKNHGFLRVQLKEKAQAAINVIKGDDNA